MTMEWKKKAKEMRNMYTIRVSKQTNKHKNEKRRDKSRREQTQESNNSK